MGSHNITATTGIGMAVPRYNGRGDYTFERKKPGVESDATSNDINDNDDGRPERGDTA